MMLLRTLIAICVLAMAPAAADAFCGFYVAGSNDALVNNATQVVMMRKGTTTVLSMQNNYQGPPSDFAMVVPVPVVLQEDNVKTLPGDIFARVDRLAAPRLVEYWEQDPCSPPRPPMPMKARRSGRGSGGAPKGAAAAEDLGVTVEAQFTVGEYEIVILSAKFSTGLEEWLLQEKYSIPAGAEKYLRPYVETGSKFFVAKVNAQKVTFQDGRAKLSPLRFHYESESFNLPVRLGLMNSSGHQDLLVHILAEGKRYEVANYPNVTIPTNLNVREEMRGRFGEFYAALFDSTLEKNPRSVVTEYAWSAGSCDPCPTPPLSWADLSTLGYDVVGLNSAAMPPSSGGAPPPPPMRRGRGRRVFGSPGGFVLTRLHARYDKDDLGEDLIFKEAGAIVGGREFLAGEGVLEQGAQPGYNNNFQARYAIRHEWKGAIQCENPQRGIWGAPPAGQSQPATEPATDLAFVARGGIQLASVVKGGIPELGVKARGMSVYGDEGGSEVPSGPIVPTSPPKTQLPESTGAGKSKDKGGCSVGSQGAASLWLSFLMLALLGRCRRRV